MDKHNGTIILKEQLLPVLWPGMKHSSLGLNYGTTGG